MKSEDRGIQVSVCQPAFAFGYGAASTAFAFGYGAASTAFAFGYAAASLCRGTLSEHGVY